VRKFTIGRDKGCDVLIGDESVSRVHAEIWLEGGTVMIADRGSSNGTSLVRAGGSSPLNFGSVDRTDRVRFGSVTLGVQELIEAIEIKNPGVFRPAAGPPPLPPPLPPPPPPPLARAGPALVRCECGAIKTPGETCPGCRR